MDAMVISTTTVGAVGGMLTAIDQSLGGGLLAIIVKLAIDGIKLLLPKKDWAKRILPILATVLAFVLWAGYQFFTGHGGFMSLLVMGLAGGLGAIGLNEIVSTTIGGNVKPTVVATTQEPKV
jgi:hypothetical protein